MTLSRNVVQDRKTNITIRSCQAHSTFRLMFRTHLERKQRECGTKDYWNTDVDMPQGDDDDSVKQDDKRISGRMVKKTKCFFRNTKTSKDTKPYADCGLGR